MASIFTTEVHISAELHGLHVSSGGSVYVAAPSFGTIMKFTPAKGAQEKTFQPFIKLPNSAPFALCEVDDGFLIADLAHQALILSTRSSSPQIWLDDEAVPLAGPAAVAGTATHVLFADTGGPFATSLASPSGTLHAIERSTGRISQITSRLADPRQISTDGNVAFIVEYGASRILTTSMRGSSHVLTVFCNVEGLGAPTAVAANDGLVYVGVDTFDGAGAIRVYNMASGQLVVVASAPAPPASIAIDREAGVLYFTASGCLLSTSLASFT